MKNKIPGILPSKPFWSDCTIEIKRHCIGKLSFLIFITSILWLLFINNTLYAQAPDWRWVNSVGTSDGELAYTIAVDANGNFFASGNFNGSSLTIGTTILTNVGGIDIYIAKYDDSGNVLWSRSAGGSGDDYVAGITTDASGNVYVAGEFKGPTITFADTTLTNAAAGTGDIFVTKYDPSGNLMWAKRMGGSNWDQSWDLGTDAFDNILLCGGFRSHDAAFDSIILVSSGNTESDAYITKMNSSGDVLWAKSAGTGAYYDYANKICGDAFGNVYVVGDYSGLSVTWDEMTLANTLSGSSDIFILKLNADGNAVWLKSIGTPFSEYGNGITSDALGNIFISGSFSNPDITIGDTVLINMNSGKYDPFVAKYDSSGTALWAKSMSGGDDDFDFSLSCDAAGDVYILGQFSSELLEIDNTSNLSSEGDFDFLIVKYNSTGSFVWAKSAGGDDYDAAFDFAVYGVDSIYVVGGYLSATVDFYNTILTNQGDYDIFIANLAKYPVGIDETENKAVITISPNPSTDKITVSFSSEEKRELQISNMLGQIVFSKAIHSSKEEIDVSTFPNGIYVVLTAAATQKFEGKFLKQ